MLAPRRSPKGSSTVEHAGELDRVRDEPGACGPVEPAHCLGDTVEEDHRKFGDRPPAGMLVGILLEGTGLLRMSNVIRHG